MTGYDLRTLKRAQTLRQTQTDAESRLWTALRNRRLADFKFRRQQPIGPFIADFVCQERRLIVEVDGSQHGQGSRDASRDAWLKDHGYRVLRFWNNDVSRDLDSVLAAILQALTDTPSPTATSEQARKSSYPLPQGERSKERHA